MNAPSERLVFSPSVEALLVRGIGPKVTPPLKNELRELGFDLSKPLMPAYTSDSWQRAMEAVARHLYPGVSMAEAQWKLGESTVYGFEETVLGMAMIKLSRVIGPRRAMQKFPRMSRSSNNFSVMEAIEISPNEFEFVCAPYVGWPEFVQGCLSAVLDVTGAKNPKVEVISHREDTERLVIRAKWE